MLNEDIMNKFIVPRDKLSDIVGFMSLFKNREVVFKIKDIKQKRNNKGSRVDNLGKNDIVRLLNDILEEKIYFIPTKDDNANVKNQDNNADNITKIGLCVIFEFILRYYNDIDNEFVWFLDLEQAMINNIEDCKANKLGVIECPV
jgi:hypothetical protein